MSEQKTKADLKKVTAKHKHKQPMHSFPAHTISAVLPTYKLFLEAGKSVLGDDFLTTWRSISFAPDYLQEKGMTVDYAKSQVYDKVVEYLTLYNSVHSTHFRILDSNWEDVDGTDLKFLHVYLNPPFSYRLGGGTGSLTPPPPPPPNPPY
jgi:hypothetical protein